MPCRLLFAVFVAAFVFAAAPQARADDYPSRPVALVVPYTPGGSTEILARIVGDKLGKRLGKPVVVEMRPGAGTVIGATAVRNMTSYRFCFLSQRRSAPGYGLTPPI